MIFLEGIAFACFDQTHARDCKLVGLGSVAGVTWMAARFCTRVEVQW
jgi:hypothetical protein